MWYPLELGLEGDVKGQRIESKAMSSLSGSPSYLTGICKYVRAT